VPLEEHLLTRDDNGGTRRIVFMISPGEKLCLIGSDSLADLHLVQGPIALGAQPQALISAELQVLAMGTVLVVKNHFDRPLDYRALLKVPGKNPEPTSVCTIRANLDGVEHWPSAAELIAFGEFTLLDANAKTQCR
jgi:hypothetical protein